MADTETSSVKSTSSHEETTSSSPVKTRRKRAAVGSGSVESAKRGHVTRGRGSRGRGRGGRGSRGARGGSGKKRSQTDDAASRIKEHTEKRTALIEKKLDEMPAEKLREVLKGVLQKTPGILFDVMEPEGGRHNPPPNADLDWCTCSNCTQMPSVAERVCCGHVPESCVTTWPDFNILVMEEMVVGVAIGLRNDMLGRRAVSDKEFRHAAYRQFVLWRHGKLGAGNRRVIPSCAVTKIRQRWPDPFGQYTGYKALGLP